MSADSLVFPQEPFIDPATNDISLVWKMWLQNPQVSTLLLLFPLGVPSGGTGLTHGTSGGILGFTSSVTLASSVSLTASHIVLGGGPGATPTPLNSLGTVTTVLHGNAAGAPFFASVNIATETTGVLPIARGGTNSPGPLNGQAIMVSDGTRIVQGPKGISTKVLHGNASGIPQYQFVIEADQLLSDVTTLNVNTSRHGYVPKAPGDATKYLDGTGAFSVPPGSAISSVVTFVSSAEVINLAATPTDAYSHTVAAGRLANAGETLEINVGGTFSDSGSTDKRIKVMFGAATIFDSGPLAI